MKKLSENIILYVVIFACIFIIISMLFYGHPYTEITEEKLRVYQLAITALAATVGIGTVANSAKSARISAESMELTKEKEIREQSSHLIIMSLVEKVTLTLPFMIAKSPLYLSEYETRDTEHPLSSVIESARKSKYERYRKNIPIHNIKLFNSGKGSSVNLEYKFTFKNLRDFKNHNVSLPISISTFSSEAYSLKIRKTSIDKTLISFDNLYIKNKLNKLGGSKEEINKITRENFYAEEIPIKMYFDIVKPQDDLELVIPNEFIILCKHYLKVKQLQKELRPIIKKFNGENYQELKRFLDYNPILPIGEINLTYYDESLIRSGEYDSQKVNELNYTVKIKEIRMDPSNPEMYLEVNLSDPEKQSNIQKKMP